MIKVQDGVREKKSFESIEIKKRERKCRLHLTTDGIQRNFFFQIKIDCCIVESNYLSLPLSLSLWSRTSLTCLDFFSTSIKLLAFFQAKKNRHKPIGSSRQKKWLINLYEWLLVNHPPYSGMIKHGKDQDYYHHLI